MDVRDVRFSITRNGKCHAEVVREVVKIIGGDRKNEKRYYHRKKNKKRRDLLD